MRGAPDAKESGDNNNDPYSKSRKRKSRGGRVIYKGGRRKRRTIATQTEGKYVSRLYWSFYLAVGGLEEKIYVRHSTLEHSERSYWITNRMFQLPNFFYKNLSKGIGISSFLIFLGFGTSNFLPSVLI